ncbi:hypothetical protein EDD18DRAFT_539397 [Armillaria luteobubalina]|uniref:Uncharacterized protein n=1 Tax=Armillaria luteobubalina TaxID=153913 RepID=A0AA39PX87_9AGAR|nr:hypothetical protein EDD18DRAFT_539397 [Armillaria luteobubalina]
MAPRLCSFRKLWDIPFLLPANLVEFKDHIPFNENTCTTLRHLVNIQILSLIWSSYSSQSPRICLPRVSQLELRMDQQTMGTAFLTYSHFDLPSLKHLFVEPLFPQKMVPCAPMHSSTVNHLTSRWSQSRPPKISMLDIELELSSYSMLTNIRCLTIEVCPNINFFLGALSICPGKDVIFPQVSELDIICGPGFDFSSDVLDMHILVELIQSQRDQGALRESKMTWERGLVNDDAHTRR